MLPILRWRGCYTAEGGAWERRNEVNVAAELGDGLGGANTVHICPPPPQQGNGVTGAERNCKATFSGKAWLVHLRRQG